MELFYVPNKSLCSQKNKVVNDAFVEGLVSDWHLSEGFKNDKKSHGSLLNNDLPWQSKWYLKFDPPRSAQELGIEHYWSYEAPKLVNFATASDFDLKSGKPDSHSQLGKSSMSSLKNTATVVLSGSTHESLKREAYRREAYKAESEADRASAFSLQMKMPPSEPGQTKLSMLEKFTMSATKGHKGRPSHSKKH
ncbi:conserved hypothetical protein [Theileria orientalis strain Shintoku]|uniref:Uncharacterized protein n=1 Tax=Theileria orientalis strain Shintoku TaxID=869250 RepID=J7MEM9_THEOR|nr:conserved hypothetical protein [Theileria orientalis strain Shintoku]PVC54263.1 hypothetical protein MACL_00003237 [Theileria orientalis]BAM38654.1 conserved hypothetical protein [Theileria orientalis strain Shintoku]|eukprot:XP_009688955.1 conserved hypothetical protein [Theileria orientalis strain Shintoku]